MRVPDWVVGYVLEPAWDCLEGSVRLSSYRQLAKSQFDTPSMLRTRSSERLRGVVRHAALASPFYARRMKDAGIDPLRVEELPDLAALPLLTKDDLRTHLEELISTKHKKQNLVASKTGGSTGTAVQVFSDRRAGQLRGGAALLANTWSGWKLGQPIAAVWGNPPQAKTLRNRLRRALRDRILYLDTMQVNQDRVRDFLIGWNRLRPGLLYGHAHSLYLLALMLEERGVSLQPHGIVATSMMLLQSEREVIERVFARKVTNRYGCEEVSLIACECERHAGLHINAEHVAVEVLRDNGAPCHPGEDGRIVVTDMINMGMPMLRYEVGDRGVLAGEACSCGRPYPLLQSLTGRTADFLVASDGTRVAGVSLIENTLTRFGGIKQLQIVQTTVTRVNLNVVCADGWVSETESGLVRAMQEALGDRCEVSIQYLTSVPCEVNGKFRFAICRVPGVEG